MSSNENNNTLAIPTAGGIEDSAMRVMQETGAPSVTVYLAPDNDPSAVMTVVLDRAGNYRIVDDANEANSANN
ncbi:uncharacterized protein FFB20_14869 [Fusarium fujikuroi]|nr:Uncharacterized protein Y057_7552 [Fusarium fujikuroi]SCO15914.1 uncharacterized protein FFB20_14869 [Fusarium fujikuroi]SCO20708.1 uncharacterized protein FFC1_13814 [Fusarium fujikuroi]SCO45513.1 uncharacterized protein FFNC_10334 [Fusarium fujikuroi]